MSKIVFCFPYRGVGGVPVLFARIAQRLASTGEHRVFIVDYLDGAAAGMIGEYQIDLIPYHEERPVIIPEDAILVFQSLNPWAMYPTLRIPSSTRIFFWNCHPFNLVPVFPGLRRLMMSNLSIGRLALRTILRRYRNIAVRLIDFLIAHNALAFMDKSNFENTQNYLQISLPPPEFLPIPAGDLRERVLRRPRDWKAEGLRAAWIGRIADFKYPILSKTLFMLDALAPKFAVPIRFEIVGQGEYLSDLQCDLLGLRNLQVILNGEMAPSDIPSFLTDKVDILFAMGTSALEGARLGVPTVLLDIAYGSIPDGYVFTWLHERDGYSLGEIVSAAHVEPGNQSLENILQAAMTNYDEVSRAAHAYYGESHDPVGVTRKFLRFAEQSSCYYREFEAAGFSARDPLYEAFATLRKRMGRR